MNTGEHSTGSIRPERDGFSAGSVTPLKSALTSSARVVPVSAEHLRENRVLQSDSDPQVRQAYKMLRTQVLQRMRTHGLQTLAVVSPTPADGKSLTAINLAISIAQDPNHTALLVDLDLRRPSVASVFGLKISHGVDDYLRGACTLPQALCRPQPYERLVLLPARDTVAESSELLASQRVRDTIRELRARYPDRIIIFDLPPVLLCDDALTFTPAVDAALLVASEGRTRREDLQRTLELLQATKVVGTVLNRSSEPSSGVY